MKQAKIFLADERGVTETECFRSYNTFNFGDYYNQHKTALEKLYACKEDTLAGGKNFTATATLATQVIIMPVVGAVNFKKGNEATLAVNAGELLIVYLTAGEKFELINPYEKELVNFLQFWFNTNETTLPAQLISFNIENKNQLLQLIQAPHINIAKLEGRKEVVYKPVNKKSCVFAFAVQGAFEMEGILLHARDGVAFWNYEQAEIEALSNDAIIVLLEMKLD